MANCQSALNNSTAQKRRKKDIRSTSLKSKKEKGNKSPRLSKSKKTKLSKDKNLVLGLSTADILLFYINSRFSYTMYEHQFYPNIVLYYENVGNTPIENPESIEKISKKTSRLQQSSILEENQNTSEYPYDCLGLITGIDESNNLKTYKIGTGCLVAPNLILTSASLVIEENTSLPLKQLRFIPKTNGTPSSGDQSYEIIDLRVSRHFLFHLKQSIIEVNQDYALLLLSRPIERQKYLFVGFDVNNETNDQLFGNSIGLKQLKIQQKQYSKIDIKGSIFNINPQTIQHNINTKNTYGGAPIVVEYIEGYIFIVGIHSTKQSNTVCRLTESKTNNLIAWAKQMTKQTYKITSAKLINTNSTQVKKPKHPSLIEEISSMQKTVDLERQNGDSDELRFYLGKLGQLCWKNGEFNRSIICLEEGLRVCNRMHKPQSLQAAFFHNNLGLNYEKLKQYEKAFRNFQTSLRIHRRRKGQNSHGVATAYNNIGNIFKKRGRHEKALQYFAKSLKIKTTLFGSRSQGVAASLSNIALIQWQRKKYSDAIKKYKQVYSIYKEVLGPIHYQISRTLYNMALCYLAMSEYSLWIESIYESLSMIQELQMTQHPSYHKRKRLLIENLKEVINHPSCKGEFIFRALKIVSLLYKAGEDGDIRYQLEKKISQLK